MDYMGFYF